MAHRPNAGAARFSTLPSSWSVRRERPPSPIEAYLDAARTRGRQAGVAEVLDSYRNVAVTVLRAAGARRARAGARAFNALVDGFLLHHMADPRPDDEEQIQR